MKESSLRAAACLFFSVFSACVFFTSASASDCEVVKSYLFERRQDVIATDWQGGVAYRKLKTEVYPCADITMKNTHWRSQKSRDIEVTATFADQGTKAKKPECGERLLEPNEEISCTICFESASPISGLECRFK